MNRYVLALLVICSSFIAKAQYQYIPMPLSSGEWTYRMISAHQNSYVAWDYMLIGTNTDTLINGKTYKRILRREHRYDGQKPVNYPLDSRVATSPDFSYAFMREENKRVYSYGWDIEQNGYIDTVMYDFNLGIGDTMPTRFNVYPPAQYNFLYVIRTIDTVNIGGSLRKRFKAESITMLTNDTITVIEGIGSDRGLIMNNISGPYGNYELTLGFYCFKAPGVQYFTDQGPCYYVWAYGTPTSVNNTVNEKQTSIYPNPFTDVLSIDSKESSTITIYNTLGAIVAEKVLTNGLNTVQTNALSNGVYFVVIKDEAGRLILKEKMIK